MYTTILCLQILGRFFVIWVEWNTVYRANCLALGLVEMADTLSAKIGVYFVNLDALIDSIVGAHRLANVAVYAFISDEERHDASALPELAV